MKPDEVEKEQNEMMSFRTTITINLSENSCYVSVFEGIATEFLSVGDRVRVGHPTIRMTISFYQVLRISYIEKYFILENHMIILRIVETIRHRTKILSYSFGIPLHLILIILQPKIKKHLKVLIVYIIAYPIQHKDVQL